MTLIDLSEATIKSQRVGGGPVEPGLTSIMKTEHFEVGGQFKFAVTDFGGFLVGANGLIGYELVDADSPSSGVLATGSGGSLTYTFGMGAAEGDANVLVYNDRNNNGTFDSVEQFKISPVFSVMQKRVFDIVADVSNKIPNASNFFNNTLKPRSATTPGLFQRAENLLLRKDSEQDWRAAVQFNVTAPTTGAVFTGTATSGLRPDPVSTQADRTKHFDAAADVVFVNQYPLGPSTMGVSNSDWHQTIIHYQHSQHNVTQSDGTKLLNQAMMAGTIAHELGHGIGQLDHPDPDDNTNNHRVMTSQTSGTYDHLTQAEAKAFDAGA